MQIRKEKSKDHNEVFQVHQKAFGQEDESKIVDKIRLGKNFISELSIVAEIDNTIVGHILFSKIKIELTNKEEFSTLSLAPMAVLPNFQKKGIGSQLVREGLKKAKELGYDSVIVLGHKNYYPKFGFQKASNWKIKCPFEVDDEVFMAIELQPNALANKEGKVIYPKEFF